MSGKPSKRSNSKSVPKPANTQLRVTVEPKATTQKSVLIASNLESPIANTNEDHQSLVILKEDCDPFNITENYQQEPLTFSVKHESPGRIRLFCESLRDDLNVSSLVTSYLSSLPGIQAVRINTWCAALIIHFDETILSKDELLEVLSELKLSETELTAQALLPVSGSYPLKVLSTLVRRVLSFIERCFPAIVQLTIGGAAFASALLGLPILDTQILLSISIVPIFTRAFRTTFEEGRLGVDALDGIAATLMLANGKAVEACFMTALIALGEFIREQTARKCQKIVDDLLGLSSSQAWLVKGNKRICVPADQVRVADVIVVYAGELIPIDGIVLEGHGAVDQSKLTGESIPVEVSSGDKVLAATVLLEGKVYVECQLATAQCKAAEVLESIHSAPLHETRTQNYASEMADKLVVPILLGAGLCFIFTRNLVRMMSMLIFDFSTGIRIAAPTAVLSSMYRAGRRGILIKSGGALERLAKVDAVIFDKTGTLTSGSPKVTQVICFLKHSEDDLAAIAASVEERLHHPASKAIVKHAMSKNLKIPDRSESSQISGMGVKATVGSDVVLAGSRRLMDSENVSTSEAQAAEIEIANRGESIVYIALNGRLAGLITYSDQIRPEAKRAIADLKRLGIHKLVMATGDTESVAKIIAEASGITDIVSRAFPEQKADLVKELKAAGMTVAVIGDGINDSPALAHADVALSLHGSTEAARHGADIVLTDGDLRRLPEAVKIARSAMQLVRQNLSLAMIPNSAGLGLAAFGQVGPAGATLLNNGSAIVAALNSLRPLYSETWSKTEPEPDLKL
jgi:heavy metal translocating P-type ATPase